MLIERLKLNWHGSIASAKKCTYCSESDPSLSHNNYYNNHLQTFFDIS